MNFITRGVWFFLQYFFNGGRERRRNFLHEMFVTRGLCRGAPLTVYFIFGVWSTHGCRHLSGGDNVDDDIDDSNATTDVICVLWWCIDGFRSGGGGVDDTNLVSRLTTHFDCLTANKIVVKDIVADGLFCACRNLLHPSAFHWW